MKRKTFLATLLAAIPGVALLKDNRKCAFNEKILKDRLAYLKKYPYLIDECVTWPDYIMIRGRKRNTIIGRRLGKGSTIAFNDFMKEFS